MFLLSNSHAEGSIEMRTTAKLIALFLALILCLSLLPAAALASDEPLPQEPAEDLGDADAPAAAEPEPEPLAEAAPDPDPALYTLGPVDIDEAPALDGALKAVSITGTYHQSDARSMLAMINDFRTGPDAWYWNADNTAKIACQGLGKLTYDYALEQIAMQRAAEIAIYFDHTRPDGTRCFTCTYNGIQSWGENIAWGTNWYYNTEAVFTSWQENDDGYNGQGHRRNMLNGSFTAIGIACFEYNGAKYWVQEFGYSISSVGQTAAKDGQETRSINVLTDDPVDPSALPEGSIEINAANFPDDTFRAVVAYFYDPNGDGWLTPDERASFIEFLCYGADISSLKGIEFFPEIIALDCSFNNLTELDLSGNPNLAWMDCSYNNLTELDLSGNPKLAWLYCEVNPLKSLDLHSCPELLAVVRENNFDSEDGVTFYWKWTDDDGYLWALSFDEGVTLKADVSPTPAALSVKLAPDGGSAQITGDYTGLYARVALVIDNNGESGLFLAQRSIETDGTINIPALDLPGLTVTGVNVALVYSQEDITSRSPNCAAMDYLFFQ